MLKSETQASGFPGQHSDEDAALPLPGARVQSLVRELKRASPGGSVERNPPAMKELQETRVQSLGREDPLEESMETHSTVLAWRIPGTEEPGEPVYSVAKSQTRLSMHTHWELRSCKLRSASKKKAPSLPPFSPLLLHVSKSWCLSLQNTTHIYTHLSICTNTGPSHFPRLYGQLDSSPFITLGTFSLVSQYQPK